MSLHHCWGWQPHQTASHIHTIHMQSVWVHQYAVHGHMAVPQTVILTLIGSDFGVLAHCGVKMMSLRHGWARQPPQTASRIHIRHMQSVWAHCYAVHGYMAVDSNSYTHTTWVRFGVLAHLWSQNDVIISWLRLTATSNCFPHPHWTYTKCLSTLVCGPWACGSSLTKLYPHYLGQILEFWLTCWVKMMSLCHGWGWQPHQTASRIHIERMQSVWAHWYAVHGYTAVASNSYTHTTWLRF